MHPLVAQCLSGLTRLGWEPASQRKVVHMGRAEVSSTGCRILVEERHLGSFFASLTGSRWPVNVPPWLWRCRSLSHNLLFFLSSSLCSLDSLLGFCCENLELSIRFPVSWEHAALRPHRAELFGDTSDTATAQLGQTSPRAESTCREGAQLYPANASKVQKKRSSSE